MGVEATISKAFILCVIVFPLACYSKHDCRFNISVHSSTDVQLYDFTSLAGNQKVWQVEVPGEDKTGKTFIFLSLCQPLQQFDTTRCPDTKTSVCVAKERSGTWTNIISNAGTNLEIQNSGTTGPTVTLSGDLCKAEKNYTTVIKFSCTDDDEDPMFINKDDCTLLLTWHTSVACPVKDISMFDTCAHSVPHFGKLDVRPLHHSSYYLVPGPDGRLFELNICGPVLSGHCNNATACEIDKTNNTVSVIGRPGSKIIVSKETGIDLIYKTGKGGPSTHVHLVCDEGSDLAEPRFLHQTSQSYHFEIETYLACQPSPVQCEVFDPHGNKYNLNPLKKSSGNWEARDARPSHASVRYHINICGSVNPVTGAHGCAGSSIGACQINESSGTASSLGTLSQGPVIDRIGHLTVHYIGGSVCRNQTRRSTHLSLECSSKEAGPVFQEETEDCVFLFHWKTPAACPSKSAVGHTCMLREPTYSYQFDFQPLHNEGADYSMQTDSGDGFRLHLCGSIAQSCNGKTNVSVCLTRNDKEVVIGYFDNKPLFTDGRIQFEFHGDECKPGQNSTALIIMHCSLESDSGTGPQFLSSDDSCNFYFLWESKTACAPYSEIECRVTDEHNLSFDLTPLIRNSGSHISISRSQNTTRRFLINICRSVVYGFESGCHHSTGVCLHQFSDDNSSFIGIGDVDKGPYIGDDGHVKLDYVNGASCFDSGSSARRYSTTIIFDCEKDLTESYPEFIGETNCHFEFLWRTAYACPLDLSKTTSIHSAEQHPCTAVNSVTNFRFDLNSLAGKEFNIEDDHGHKYSLSVCGSLKNSICGTGVGSCQYEVADAKNNWSAGRGNSDLRYHLGSLYLHYQGGAPCSGGVTRNTRLDFVCRLDSTTESEGPKFIEEVGECNYIITWTTHLACENRTTCQVLHGDKAMNLASLIQNTHNYNVNTTTGEEFFINVCRPLVPERGLTCSGGAAACIARRHSDGDLTDEKNLGFPYYRPVVQNGGVTLKYLRGSPCPMNPGLNLSTSLHFVCSHGTGKGSPVFENFTDCQYQFLWKTEVICDPWKEMVQLPVDKCLTYSDQNDMALNLTQVYLNHTTPYKVTRGNKVYVLNLCGMHNVCDGAPVCEETNNSWLSYGRNVSVEFNYADSYTKLIYSHGSTCFKQSNQTYSAQVWFKCDMNDSTQILADTECSVVVEWRSSAACPSRELHTAPSTYSQAGLVIGLLVALLALCLVALFFRKSANRSRFMAQINTLLRRQPHQQFHYSRLEASAEVNMLLNTQDSESDDELLRT